MCNHTCAHLAYAGRLTHGPPETDLPSPTRFTGEVPDVEDFTQTTIPVCNPIHPLLRYGNCLLPQGSALRLLYHKSHQKERGRCSSLCLKAGVSAAQIFDDKNGNYWDGGVTYAELSRLRALARLAVLRARRKIEKGARWQTC